MFKWITKKFAKQQNYSAIDGILRSAGMGLSPVSSVRVTETTALNLVAVLAAVRYLSEDIASLPFPVYQFLPDSSREKVRSHPVWRVLNDSPDDIITAMQHREYQMKQLLLTGNSYDEIEFNRDGSVRYLHRLPSNKVRIKIQPDGSPLYFVDGVSQPIPHERMLHISILGDGLEGMSVIKAGSQSIAAGLMQDKFASAWFANGSRGAGVLSSPQTMTAKQLQETRQELEHIHGGPENFGKWIILDGGKSLNQLAIPADDAQFLETRVYTIQEIARLFRVPPAMLMELSHGTLANTEQQDLQYQKSIRPWLVRIEQQINRKLFSEDERENLYAEHNFDALLRTDTATRVAAFTAGRNGGWYSVNDIREMLNLNGIGPAGDIYLMPLNNTDAQNVAADTDDLRETDEPAGKDQPKQTPDKDQSVIDQAPETNRTVQASLDVVADNLDRMLRRESEALRKAARKPEQFLQFLDEFYANHKTIVERAMKPSVTAYGLLINKDISPADIANTICGGNKDELLELSGTVSATDLPKAITRFTKDQAKRSATILQQLA